MKPPLIYDNTTEDKMCNLCQTLRWILTFSSFAKYTQALQAPKLSSACAKETVLTAVQHFFSLVTCRSKQIIKSKRQLFSLGCYFNPNFSSQTSLHLQLELCKLQDSKQAKLAITSVVTRLDNVPLQYNLMPIAAKNCKCQQILVLLLGHANMSSPGCSRWGQSINVSTIPHAFPLLLMKSRQSSLNVGAGGHAGAWHATNAPPEHLLQCQYKLSVHSSPIYGKNRNEKGLLDMQTQCEGKISIPRKHNECWQSHPVTKPASIPMPLCS